MTIPNKKQKITAIAFAAMLTLMCLFPPTRFTQTFLYSNGKNEITSTSGFRFIGNLRTKNSTKSYSIDTTQLLLQVLVTCLAGVAVLYALNEHQKKD